MLERLQSINLNHLVVLSVLLDEANVTRAAKRLGLTQSATSHALAALRREFADELLVRTNRGMILTEEARRLKPELEHVLGELANVLAERRHFDVATATKTFSLATADFLVAPVGRELGHQLAKRAPHASLRLEQLRVELLEERLKSRATDVALGPMIPFEAGIESEFVYEEHFVTALSADHPACRKTGRSKTLPLELYTSLDHILISPTDRGQSRVDVRLLELGLRRRIAVRFESFLAAGHALVGSRWVLTAPRSVFSGHERKLRLFIPPVDLLPLRMGLHYDRARRASSELTWFRGEVKKAIRRL